MTDDHGPPRYFKTQAAFRNWLEKNHSKATDLEVGFYKKHTNKPTITYQQALDEALCFGWIDGVRHSVDDERFRQRFTPRKARSPWSRINIARVAELKKLGFMHEAGLRAFESRDKARDTAYAREEGMGELSPASIREFKRNKSAWKNWNAFPLGYRRTAAWWVMSAKREETRTRRLNTLIEDTGANRRIASLSPSKRRPD